MRSSTILAMAKSFLAMVLATSNLLAFAWNSMLDLLEPPLAGRPRGGGQANKILYRYGDPYRLRCFPLLARLHQIPRDLRNPPQILF
jgi:hypothetical protein